MVAIRKSFLNTMQLKWRLEKFRMGIPELWVLLYSMLSSAQYSQNLKVRNRPA